jgi:uncharacterized membrane protein YcaP (DUF421 family)
MFEMGTAAWAIALRTALVYLGVVLGLRLAGKRGVGQLTLVDLVLILLVGNAVQNAMTGPDFSLQGGLLAVAVLLALDRLLTLARARGTWARLLQGGPTILVDHGRPLEDNLRREGVRLEEVEMAAREHGLGSLDDVRLAVLETDGSISVVPRTSVVHRSRRLRRPKRG